MADLRSIRAHVSTEALVRPRGESYAERLAVAQAANLVCGCGDLIAGARTVRISTGLGDTDVIDDPRVPARENGRPRGVCRCYRARTRQIPVDANR